jgi:hypothetical protein
VRRLSHVAGAAAFLVLATLNSGGYRYGAADQAFYIPAILKQLDPSLFPRDTALVGPQARYFVVDEIVAGAIRLTGWPMEAWFAAGYVISMAVLYAALWRFGESVFVRPQATWALLAAETLRHRITKTGVNTLEGYFHPRVLVFAIGVWAIGTYLRGRAALALAAVLVGGLLHPTTAAFFLVFLVPAIWMTEVHARRGLGVAITLAIGAASWMLLAAPLTDALAPMDQEWRALLAPKDYLFPSRDWNAGAWAANLGTAALGIGTLAYRVSQGLARRREAGLLAGASVLLLGFLVTLPAVTAGSALFVQLQISRVFWILDLLGTVALVWWLADTPARPGEAPRRALIPWLALPLAALTLARGSWITWAEHGERPMVSYSLPAGDWTAVIEWARRQPATAHLLADPGHAWKFGTPLRYGGRDVFLEDVKDTAMAIYARSSAQRVIERQAAIGDFDTLDADRARRLALRYALDYLVIDRDLPLPVAERIGRFRIYALR